jgi:hypothetical protein
VSRAEHLSHAPYSPNLAPNDFFLFGYIKGKLSDSNCESREDLLSPVTEFFTGVDQEIPLSVFESRVKLLKLAVKHEGKYSTKKRTKDISSRLAHKRGEYVFAPDCDNDSETREKGDCL